jgi:hypothetical protein
MGVVMPANQTVEAKEGIRISVVIRHLEAIKKQEGDLYVCLSSDQKGSSHHPIGEILIMDGMKGGAYATLWPSDREVDVCYPKANDREVEG